jgi:YHS domain-containing protein
MPVDPLRDGAELTDDAEASRPRGQPLRPASFQQVEPRASVAEHSRLPSPLEGYCPVELRENEKWAAGRAEYQATYHGQVYRFSSSAAQKRFLAAPQNYAPVRGGNDIVAAIDGNASILGSIQNSAVWQGRLYLFANPVNLAAFRKNPARYVTREPTAPQPVSQKLLLPGDSL